MSKKIALYEYRRLSDEEQYTVIFTVGTFIDSKIYGNQRSVLYAVDMFFVEVEYDNEKNKVIDKQAFVSGEILDKYSALDLN